MDDAIEVLTREASRIVLIIDDRGKLLGTVTDGDIRRALLRSCAMTTPLGEVMNKKPMVASAGVDRQELLIMLKSQDLLHIPLVDRDGVLVGLETYQHLVEKPTYENCVFLMAGGFGTRLRPLTYATPKPLLKIGRKPILETIVEQFVESGFVNFIISTHYKAEMVQQHFGTGDKWNARIGYVYEDKPIGTAGALGLIPDDIADLPIIMMNGDLLTKVNFGQLLKFHQDQGGLATMCVREYDLQVPYGVVQADGLRITGIIEKPVQKFFVNAGIYVLERDLVRSVDGKKHLDMPTLLGQCIDGGGTVSMFPVHEYWLDIGNFPDYQKANDDANRLWGVEEK